VLRSLYTLASPAGPRGGLSVLIFHRVLAQADPLFPQETDARRFDAVCGWLRDWCNVLPLDTAVRRLQEGRLPARALAITFDDGYADNHDVALPILARHGLAATFFVATGFLDGGRMWNDTLIESLRRTPLAKLDVEGLGAGVPTFEVDTAAQKRAAIDTLIAHAKYMQVHARERFVDEVARRCRVEPPGELMLSSQQVRQLRAAGMQIGAHTVSHPILARLPAEGARQEILASKKVLESLLQEPIGLFAYPNGKPERDYGVEAVDIVRECGFDAAFSTAPGVARTGADPYQLPRFTPWDHTRTRFGLRLIRNAA